MGPEEMETFDFSLIFSFFLSLSHIHFQVQYFHLHSRHDSNLSLRSLNIAMETLFFFAP